jgi:PGF-CTERM protein
MRAEALLAVVGIAALFVTVLLAVLVPGFVAAPDDPPARLDVAETTLETGKITGETATFGVTAYLRHRGGTAENVTVAVRAIDDSGVLADSSTRERSDLDSEREHQISQSVTLPREGGYQIRVVLYVDGKRVDVAEASVSGVEGLTPPHAASNVAFHRFGQQPSVEYTIDTVDNGTATLGVTSYLTNRGDEPESGIRISVTARHAEAGVVADRTDATVGEIAPGRTETVKTSVMVPDGSNYYLDVTLWRDGVVLDSTRSAANLDPQRTVSVGEQTESIEFDAGEFETTRGGQQPSGGPEDAESQPGFGVAVAVIALVLGTAVARRWSR